MGKYRKIIYIILLINNLPKLNMVNSNKRNTFDHKRKETRFYRKYCIRSWNKINNFTKNKRNNLNEFSCEKNQIYKYPEVLILRTQLNDNINILELKNRID